MQGGDASHDGGMHAFFNVKNVPEARAATTSPLPPPFSTSVTRADCPPPSALQVFSYFDEFSWELSKLDLTHFRQNAMRNDIVRPPVRQRA